jgi:predicted secreted hydrolase
MHCNGHCFALPVTLKTRLGQMLKYMGHVGLRDGKQAWFEERFARGGVGNAGISSIPFNAFIDD